MSCQSFFSFPHLIKNKVILNLKKLNINQVNIWNTILNFHCVNLSNTDSFLLSLYLLLLKHENFKVFTMSINFTCKYLYYNLLKMFML